MNVSILTSDKPLKVRIKKVAEGRADLILPDNQEITISDKYIPSKSKAGEFLFLNLICEEDLARGKKEIANEVLREILH